MSMGIGLGQALRAARNAKGLTIKAVAEHVGISASAISQWESGETEPGLPNLAKAAALLDVDPFDLILAAGPVGPAPFAPELTKKASERRKAAAEARLNNVEVAANAPLFENIQGLARDVPVYGIAVAGSDADFRLNGNEVDRAVRPPGLKNVKGLFALYVNNDSMYPAWREGALFYINPNRPPKVGDDVVVEYLPHDGEPGAAFLKRLKAKSRGKYVVEQFNPPQELEFEQSQVRLYRVVPWEEALGLS